jgi:hypothetical protein
MARGWMVRLGGREISAPANLRRKDGGVAAVGEAVVEEDAEEARGERGLLP